MTKAVVPIGKMIGDQLVSDDIEKETSEKSVSNDAVDDPVPGKDASDSGQSGPKFGEAPDPLAGVKKGVSDAMAGMEGKTVSMKLYVGTIIGVVILMLLARCGGQ
ncbi:MAG TPA: hypothetical protein VIR79_03530 [Nitrospira sp.]|jgi:hypothetical protein|nr:hypothetical protein [Gammaproteobacteria bacterium]MDH3862479.1 hypothetical protein [Gammaproteobacteria bacterium]MDH3904455.1 hypothetical protein [Gammaproteobacteria bacterium]MDH3982857.1 hypothetical protein [Gammaproteobacteria bacterium]